MGVAIGVDKLQRSLLRSIRVFPNRGAFAFQNVHHVGGRDVGQTKPVVVVFFRVKRKQTHGDW